MQLIIFLFMFILFNKQRKMVWSLTKYLFIYDVEDFYFQVSLQKMVLAVSLNHWIIMNYDRIYNLGIHELSFDVLYYMPHINVIWKPQY